MEEESNKIMIAVTIIGIIIIPIIAALIKNIVSHTRAESAIRYLQEDVEKDEQELKELKKETKNLKELLREKIEEVDRNLTQKEASINDKIDGKMMEVLKNQSESQIFMSKIDNKLSTSLEVLQKIVEMHENKIRDHENQIIFFNRNIQDFYEKYDLTPKEKK